MRMVFEDSDFENAEVLDMAIEHFKALRASLDKKNAKDASKATEDGNWPALQLAVLRVLGAAPSGQATSYEVAAALGMSQPEYAAKIRGTGKASEKAQDYLYLRSWAFDADGKRMRVYTITPEGRAVLAKGA